MTIDLLLFGFLTLLAAILAWRCGLLARRWNGAEAMCAVARQGEANVTRSLQLFASELQATGLTLRGHADHLAAEQHAHAPALAVVAAQIGALADEIGHHLLPAGLPRALDCEAVLLRDLAAEAVQAMTEAISPGHRHWRIAGREMPEVVLWADRRALRLVVVRVLGEAVRSSSHNDWIEIGWTVDGRGIAIHVEDEGAGASWGESAMTTATSVDSRGIGLRLALARVLTQAHGGVLEVEALAHVGTRVTIILPAERLQGASPLPMAAAGPTPIEMDRIVGGER